MSYAVETVNLGKKFIQHKKRENNVVWAIKDVSIRINPGESLALLGPNASGKTTLLKLLATLILPTEGRVYIDGYDILKCPGKTRRSIGLVVSGERSFYWRLTGRQNLDFFASLYGLSRLQIKKKIKALAELLEVSSYLDYMFYEYSSGIKQRFSIARSLIHEPAIVLFDEPTKSLDASTAENLLLFIKNKVLLEEKRTILFTTHNYKEAVILADKVVILQDGRINSYNTPYELNNMQDNL
ncbi:MAG: ABC transporter ATP-binding protein [Candidatus Omnitrophica bacterium]|nr:ABC transporter ATP-binding protein [Candidatus Omnitrophota bacterium]